MFSAPIIIVGGIKLGVYSAKRAHKNVRKEDPIDFLMRTAIALTYSVPSFVLSLLSISIFFLFFNWIAPGRISFESELFIYSGNWTHYTGFYTIDALLNGQFWIFVDALRHLMLPVATLTISMLPVVAKVTRSSMLTEFSNSYVIAAEAKGLKDSQVISRVRKNAMVPILTISSTLFANMLTGIAVTEYVFGLPGVGSLAVAAAKRYDIALLVGLALVFCVIFMIISLLVDLVYTHLDPRVKL
jgi:peptide/nickel transport system permease protein